MLSRISTALFKPRLIAQYLVDKVYKPILFLIIMILIGLAPYSVTFTKGHAIFPDEYERIREAVKTTSGEVTFNNGTLTMTKDYKLNSGDFLYCFALHSSDIGNSIVNITVNKVELYFFGIKINEINHNLNNVTLNSESTDDDIFEFSYLVYNFLVNSEPRIKVAYGIFCAINELLFLAVLVLIMYLAGYLVNPIVKGKFRSYILVYSLSSYFIFNAISLLFGIELITYIGVAYAMIAYYKALRAIVKIEVRKE